MAYTDKKFTIFFIDGSERVIWADEILKAVIKASALQINSDRKLSISKVVDRHGKEIKGELKFNIFSTELV